MVSILILMMSFCSAEDKVPVKDGYKTMDMSEFKDLDKLDGKKNHLNVSTGCQSKTGVFYKSSDAGYSACLSESQTAKDAKQSGSAPTTSIHFGE